MKSFIFIALLSVQAQAWDSAKCSKMLNDGLYMDYEWGGVGDYNMNAMTKETKKSGSSTATSKISVEGSTAILDPKYSSNVSTSETQTLSSWGDCSLFALNERKIQRELFIDQNLDQIKNEVAHGGGKSVDILAWFSMCEDQVKGQFEAGLQKNFKTVFSSKNGLVSTPQKIDQVIQSSETLNGKCFNLSSITR